MYNEPMTYEQVKFETKFCISLVAQSLAYHLL